ncbi:MAG: zinc ribbon domain-containing protein [Lachnospiraceae bacterium]|nr:zinc ribbon domain-containing protein [Lachnospiraceae bacterium]
MGNFCTKCGSPLGENMKFCTKCGAPNPAVQNTAPQPQPVQPQVQMTVQPLPPAQVPPQPQPQYVYNQQPRQAPPQQTVYYQPAPQEKPQSSGVGRRVACIILGVILTAEVCFALFVYPKFIDLGRFKKSEVAMTNIPNAPKERYLFFLENSFPMIEEKFSDLGTKQFDLFFSMGVDESGKSHQTDTQTTVSLRNMEGEEENVGISQFTTFNKDTGDASMGLNYEYGDAVCNTGVYFTGNEMNCLKKNGVVVQYNIPDEQKAGIRNMCAADKFAMIKMGKYSEEVISWEEQMDQLKNGVFAEYTDDDFEITSDSIDILEGNCKCEVVTTTKHGAEGVILFNEIFSRINMVADYPDFTDPLKNAMNEEMMTEDEKAGAEVTVDAISYRNVPVGLRITANIRGESIKAVVFAFYDGNEEHTQFTINVPTHYLEDVDYVADETSEYTEVSYVDKVFSKGGGNYKYETDIKSGTFKMNTELSGTISDSSRKMSGDFEVQTTGNNESDWLVTGKISISESTSSSSKTSSNVIDFKIVPIIPSELADEETENQEMNGTIRNETTSRFVTPSIDPPIFIEGSGVNVGSDKDMLTENLRKADDSMFESKNCFIRTLAVYISLM